MRAAERAGKHVDRSSYGFKTDEVGYLIPNENYQCAREVIEAIEELDWSTRKTARHTGVSWRMVNRILDRRDLYLGATAPADD